MTILFHSLKNYLVNEIIDSSPNTLKQRAAVAVTRGRTNSKSQTGFQFKQSSPNFRPLSSKFPERPHIVLHSSCPKGLRAESARAVTGR